MKGVVRRNTGESYEKMLVCLVEESSIQSKSGLFKGPQSLEDGKKYCSLFTAGPGAAPMLLCRTCKLFCLALCHYLFPVAKVATRQAPATFVQCVDMCPPVGRLYPLFVILLILYAYSASPV